MGEEEDEEGNIIGGEVKMKWTEIVNQSWRKLLPALMMLICMMGLLLIFSLGVK